MEQSLPIPFPTGSATPAAVSACQVGDEQIELERFLVRDGPSNKDILIDEIRTGRAPIYKPLGSSASVILVPYVPNDDSREVFDDLEAFKRADAKWVRRNNISYPTPVQVINRVFRGLGCDFGTRVKVHRAICENTSFEEFQELVSGASWNDLLQMGLRKTHLLDCHWVGPRQLVGLLGNRKSRVADVLVQDLKFVISDFAFNALYSPLETLKLVGFTKTLAIRLNLRVEHIMDSQCPWTVDFLVKEFGFTYNDLMQHVGMCETDLGLFTRQSKLSGELCKDLSQWFRLFLLAQKAINNNNGGKQTRKHGTAADIRNNSPRLIGKSGVPVKSLSTGGNSSRKSNSRRNGSHSDSSRGNVTTGIQPARSL